MSFEFQNSEFWRDIAEIEKLWQVYVIQMMNVLLVVVRDVQSLNIVIGGMSNSSGFEGNRAYNITGR